LAFISIGVPLGAGVQGGRGNVPPILFIPKDSVLATGLKRGELKKRERNTM